MRIYLLLLVLFCSSKSFSQTQVYLDKDLKTSIKPLVIVDSYSTDFDYYNSNPDNIFKIDIVKNKEGGEIHVTSKNPELYKFVSYNKFKETYFGNSSKPILLLVNSQFVKDYSNKHFDENYINDIEVEKGNDYNELKNAYSSYTIVNIRTKNHLTKKNERPVALDGMPKGTEPQ